MKATKTFLGAKSASLHPAGRWLGLFTMAAALCFFTGCATTSTESWAITTTIPADGKWHVLYGNHWPNRFDKIVVVNASHPEGADRQTELVLAHVDPVAPPEPGTPEEAAQKELPTVKRDYEPVQEFSTYGSKRLLIIDSGWRLAVRTQNSAVAVKVRLIGDKPIH